MNQNQTIQNEIDVRKIVRIALEHYWWFVIGIVFFLSVGTLYYLRKNTKWKTDASIMLRQNDMASDQFSALSMLGIGSNAMADDEAEVFASRGLMYQSLDALNLWEYNFVKDGLRWVGEFRSPAMHIDYLELTKKAKTRPFIVTVKPTKSGYKVKTKMGFFRRSTKRVKDLSAPIETAVGTIMIHPNRPLSTDTTYRVIHMVRELVVADYQMMLKVKLHKKESNIINMTITSPMPERDKALLYQLIEQYNMNAMVDKNMIASNTAKFIEERLNLIAGELSDAEKALSDYKEQNNIADMETQAQLFLHASSAEQREMAEIETQLSLVDYVDEFLRDNTKRNNLIPANIGITDASLGSSLSEYNAMLLHRMRIQRTATENNPVVEQIDMQLATMRQNIIATIGSVRASLNIRKESLQMQDDKFSRQIKNAPEKEREYVRVARDQKLKERLYLYLYEKREENALMLAATSIPAKVIDMPQRDVQSGSPKLRNLIIICLFLGIAFPAGLLYLLMLFNDKIDDQKEYEKRLNAPVLGALVENSRNAHIAIREGESTVSAELFRLIRTNLRYMIPTETKSPVILVTSCINGEGKSYVSTNTALSLAILGKKVVLVGLDIRKPMLSVYFNLNTKGHLTDYLAEPDITVDDIIVPSGEHKNLDLIPCGAIPPNPSELLQNGRLDGLFAELRKRYDYIIVDTAPVEMVSDTYLLDRLADMTIFVCRYKYTPSEMLDRINQMIEQKRMHNVAGVLNGVKGLKAGYGYGYGAQQS